IDGNGASVLIYAARAGKQNIVTYLLDQRINVNVKDKSGRTALSHALERNFPELVPILVAHNAHVDHNNLFFALRHGMINIIKLFIEHVKQLNVHDAYGFTPLLYAIAINDKALVEKVICQGASVDIAAR